MRQTVLLALLACTLAAADLPRVAGGKPAPLDFVPVWGVDAADVRSGYGRHGDLSATQIAATVPANILWPGDRTTLTVQLANAGKQSATMAGRWVLVPYRLTTRSEDVFDLGVERGPGGELAVGELAPVTLPAGGFAEVQVEVDPPARCGGHALLLQLDGGVRLFVAGLARTVKPDQEPGDRFHQVAMDLDEPDAIRRLRTPANRLAVPYVPHDDPKVESHRQRFARQLDGIQATGFPVIVEFGAGPERGAYLPMGRTRPHLDAQNRMMPGKADYSWLPAYDKDFKAYVKSLALAYGWPKGPINAMKLWNEPWNGLSISGWGGDDLRYREIYTAMCEAVEEARAEGGVQILLGGCDSSPNTFDKLFPDGRLDFLPRLDFLSTHYQGLNPASTVRMWRDRTGPEGRVRIWDTESWVANSGDRVPGVLAGMLAAGNDRVVGIQSNGCVATPSRVRVQLAGGKTEERRILHAWPVAPALAAFQHHIGQRRFAGLLWEGLPWVFRFDGRERGGKAAPDDLAVIVCGDIGSFFGAENTALRDCRGLAELRHEDELRARLAALPAGDPQRAGLERGIAAWEVLSGASLTLPAGRWSLVDGDGNPVPAQGGSLRIPLDGSGWYLRPDGSAGSGAALLAALRTARVEGYEPLSITVRDPLEPIATRPVFRLELKNVLNRPVAGALRVTATDLDLDVPARIALAAHERRVVEVRIRGGTASPGNRHALRVVFDAGADGTAVHEEELRVNRIARRTVTVDGDLAEWAGVLPQPVVAGGGGPTMMEKAWLPMVKPDAALEKGFATAWLAADAAGFHIALRIADRTVDPGMQRFATRDPDADYYPAVVQGPEREGYPELRWPEGVRIFSYRRRPELPNGSAPNHDNVQIAFNVLPEDKKSWYPAPPGVFKGYAGWSCTDYEFALNPVREADGGGTEVWCLRSPTLPDKHYYPRSPKAPGEGAVAEARLAILREDGFRIVECTIPWSAIPQVREARDQGRTVKFSYRVNDEAGGSCMELARGRSVSKRNLSFKPDWGEHWANEVEFSWEK